MIHERMVELNTLLILLYQLKDVDYRFDPTGAKVLCSVWEDEYNLNKMQERANELLKEFLQPYVINSDSKE
jgi:hypothetical protein